MSVLLYAVQYGSSFCLSTAISMKKTRKLPPGGTRTPNARKPGQRAGLTQEDVLSAAMRIVEQRGLEQVSMRRIADALGVAPNALYSYFADKTTLLDALFDAILGEIEVPVPAGEPWQDRLADLMRASRRLVLAHPHLATLFLTRPGGPNAMRLGEATLRILEEGGVSGPVAVTALRALLTYTIGFAAMEVPRLVGPDRAGRTDRARHLIESLEPEASARTRGLAREIASHPEDEDFEAGLRWLIRGIETEDDAGDEGVRG